VFQSLSTHKEAVQKIKEQEKNAVEMSTVTSSAATSDSLTEMQTPTRHPKASSIPRKKLLNSAPKDAKEAKEGKEKPDTQHAFLLCNHLENNYHLSNKKALYYNMKTYYENTGKEWFHFLPLTFHIKDGVSDKEFQRF